MSQVSLYQNNRDTQGFDPVSIEDIYNAIKNGDWEKYAEPVRKEEYGSDKQKSLKNGLPAFTMSGVFPKGSRLNESIVSHSGRIVIDIDGLKDSVQDVKETLKDDPYSESVFLSVSGKGLAVVVKIDGRKHVDSFLELEKYYLNNYGLKIDQSCKNVARIRYVTSDPEIYINMESKLFELEQLQIDSFIPDDYEIKERANFDENSTYTVADEIVKRSVKMIETAVRGQVHENLIRASNLAGGYIAGGLVDEELVKSKMLAAILSKPKNKGHKWELSQIEQGIKKGKERPIKELLVSDEKKDPWAGKSPEYIQAMKDIFAFASSVNRMGRKYSPTDIENKSREFEHIDGINMVEVEKVFKRVAVQQKDYFNWDEKSNVEKVEIHIRKNWELRYNIVRNTVDCREVGKRDFKELKIENIYRNLQHNRIKYTLSDLKNLLNSDFIKEYDPIDNYFSNLPEWDGKDHITDLARHIVVKRQDYFNSMLKKHLVRSVKCGLGKGVNRFLFTIVGEKQSTGKTYFLRWLCPFDTDYYTEASINAKDKDTKIAVARNFFYNIDELASLRKNDIDSLKSLISIDKINERLPYGSSAVTMRRRANFFASTNNTQFLVDIENTRWLVFDLQKIDRAYSKTMDVDQVWAQAYHLFKDPEFNDQLTQEESEIQAGENKGFNYQSPEEEAIKMHFKVSNADGSFYSTFDIMVHLNEMYPKASFSSIGIGRAMKNIGFKDGRKVINGKKQRGFYAEMIKGNYSDDAGDQKNLFDDDGKKPF